MLFLATTISKLLTFATRLNGGGGSALPGLVIEKIFPNILPKLVKSMVKKSVIITGTNGKTTTAKLIAAATKESKLTYIHNQTGSNMRRGLIGTLLQRRKFFKNDLLDWGIFEVDEAALRIVASEIKPEIMVVTNLSRDQLDRYGELAKTADYISQGLKHAKQIVLNADDANVATLSTDETVSYFGANSDIRKQLPDDSALYASTLTQKTEQHTVSKIVEVTDYSDINNNVEVDFKTVQGNIHLSTELFGVHNAYNIAAAISTTLLMGLENTNITTAISVVKPPFGRGQVVEYNNRNIQIMLAKNPSGLNQTLQFLSKKQQNVTILFIINDNFADGRDVSWLWDSQLELLKNERINVYTSGLRGQDMTLRLKYADIQSTYVESIDKAIKLFTEALDKNELGYVIPTYTAMLELHDLVVPGKKHEVWQ